MSSIKLFFVLILATALDSIVATRSAALFSTTASLSNSKAYAPTAKLTPSIVYILVDNSTSLGNSRFEKEIGDNGVDILSSASEYILDTLYHGRKPQDVKDYSKVVAVIESLNQDGIRWSPTTAASTVRNEICLNSDYIQHFNGDIRYEFTGIMYQESKHIWQWNGNGTAPAGLINGMAGYLRLKAGWPSVSWERQGSGNQWDEGYHVTAYFLEYCNSIKDGFVAELNAMIRDHYGNDFFVTILGKSVDEPYGSTTSYEGPTPAPTPGS
ncbi:uncharacterized protein LOC116193920 [Punica granatum]|nr:uncharacterized protein LOC116193920 [Punica granatum]